MRVLFWLSLFLVFFSYGGYPICLYLRARFWPRPVRRAEIFPTITVILAARNEENHLPGKLRNLSELDYPAELLDVIVISDGSTDRTNRILSSWQGERRRAILLAEHGGKAHALNCGIAQARGEIICFTDTRQIIDRAAMKNLAKNFADPAVGCASGELMQLGNGLGSASEGIGLYWRMEKKVRRWRDLQLPPWAQPARSTLYEGHCSCHCPN